MPQSSSANTKGWFIVIALVEMAVPMTPLAGTALGLTLLVIAGVLALGLGWSLVRSTNNQQDLPDSTPISKGRSEAIKFVILTPMILLIVTAITWSYFGGLPALLLQHTAKPSIKWGFSPDLCEVNTDSAAFLKFQDEYKIAAVCGITSQSIDKYDDRNVSVSEAFTITRDPISISVLFNERTRRAFADQVAKQKNSPSPSTPPIVRERNLVLKLGHWGQLILLPKSVNSNDVKKLSDVPIYKGKILSPEDL